MSGVTIPRIDHLGFPYLGIAQSGNKYLFLLYFYWYYQRLRGAD